MGMIILPFVLAATGCFGYALYQLYGFFQVESLSYFGIGGGVLLSLILIAAVLYSWIREGKFYALSPPFRYSIYLFFVPMLVYVIVHQFEFGFGLAIETILLSSIVFSGLMVLFFSGKTFAFLSRFGLKKHF